MLEPVPLRVERRVEAVRAGEIDDDCTGRRDERGGALVAETEKEDVGAARGCLLVRDEGGQRAVQPDVEGGGRRACERVRAESDDLELRVRKDAVERLLPRIARGPEDGGRR